MARAPSCRTMHGVTFEGVEDDRYGKVVDQFKGIQYATIAKRFSKPVPVSYMENETINATRFGAQCPQPEVDVGHLLRLPEEAKGTTPEEDEFRCLNLNVYRPQDDREPGKCLPVIIWIHGGSQVVTFASAATPVCDPTRFISDSIALNRPVVFVTLNYRLNIFAFGDGSGEANLALQDQRLAIDWVVRYISDFGGDPSNLTLAGESAGAVYVHAHLVTAAPVQRAILASGSLYLSPPLTREVGTSLTNKLAGVVMDHEHCSLSEASVKTLVGALTECRINSMWLQADSSLSGWESKWGGTQSLMVGDVEYESVIWRNGIEEMTSSEIQACFESDEQNGDLLKALYHINTERTTSSKLGALDFLNDARFALPADNVARSWRGEGKRVYQYIVDQTNPWQASSRAHHAVDLVLVFGGIDLAFNPAAEEVGTRLRQTWISFANGEAPWPESQRYAFGPHGRCSVLQDYEFSYRRRTNCFASLRGMLAADYNKIVARLAAGRISLYN